MSKIQQGPLLEGATVSGAVGVPVTPWDANLSFSMIATATGAGEAQVIIEATNKQTLAGITDAEWFELGTMTVTMINGKVSEAFAIDAAYKFIRARAIQIDGGVSAVVDVFMAGDRD